MIPLASPGGAAGPPAVPEAHRQKLQQAARGFEGLFLAQLIKVMRGTTPGTSASGMAGKAVLGDYADMELGRVLAERRGIGLAEVVYRTLSAREKAATPAAAQVPADREVSPARVPLPHTASRRYYDLHVREAARQFDLHPALIRSIIEVESGGRSDARSPKNAKGLMQLTDSTADMLGVQDVWDPRENITAGARYLRALLDRFDGDLVKALAAYNAGPGAVERHGGPPPYPETQNYVRRVLDHFWNRPGGTHRAP